MLSPYRVLDLTDEIGLLCGKILGDLGADVVKIEPPGGGRARSIGPFYQDVPHPEKSLYWFAYNANKRGITLNLETADGREIFRKLVKSTDIVIESCQPGYMAGLGLDYQGLSKINPGLIMTSITCFGQTGPHKDWAGSDLVAMAMGGFMYLTGDDDGPPLTISFPQANLHASSQAAEATMVALYHREMTGDGQVVDISLQHSLVMTTLNAIPFWELDRSVLRRAGPYRVGLSTGARLKLIWRCQDGYVSFIVMGGSHGAKTNRAIVKWIADEGMADDFIQGIDWDEFDMASSTQEFHDRLAKVIGNFFTKHTKAELYHGAMEKRIMLFPASTPSDMLADPQLKFRGFWQEVEYPELDTRVVHPGAFIGSTETSCDIKRRAPLIGEHNSEIYEKELGLSREEFIALKETGII